MAACKRSPVRDVVFQPLVKAKLTEGRAGEGCFV